MSSWGGGTTPTQSARYLRYPQVPEDVLECLAEVIDFLKDIAGAVEQHDAKFAYNADLSDTRMDVQHLNTQMLDVYTKHLSLREGVTSLEAGVQQVQLEDAVRADMFREQEQRIKDLEALVEELSEAVEALEQGR